MTAYDYYGVFGNPIQHSLSPIIHHQFAKQFNINMLYQKYLVPIGQLHHAVAKFQSQKGLGLNITIPFKQHAFELVNQHDKYAAIAKAVNTICFQTNGHLLGANTDGIGLVRDLTQHHQLSLHQQSIAILGASGAVRGVIVPLLEQKPLQIIIANRTKDKAIALAKEFARYGPVFGCALSELRQPIKIIINGTAASLSNTVPAIANNIITPSTWCYDMVYLSQPTAFVAWANKLGAEKTSDGLGMLVEQAAESFFLWRGKRPQTSPVLEYLKRYISHYSLNHDTTISENKP